MKAIELLENFCKDFEMNMKRREEMLDMADYHFYERVREYLQQWSQEKSNLERDGVCNVSILLIDFHDWCIENVTIENKSESTKERVRRFVLSTKSYWRYLNDKNKIYLIETKHAKKWWCFKKETRWVQHSFYRDYQKAKDTRSDLIERGWYEPDQIEIRVRNVIT